MLLLMPRPVAIVVDVVLWALLHALTGYLAHRMSDRSLDREGWLLRARRFELGGSWYRRWFLVTRWKDVVPDAGGLFPGGISKRHVGSYDEPGLLSFIRETRRAELAHWWALWCGPLFVLWNPPLASVLLIGYGVLVNLPFVVIQRYNRIRTQSLLQRRAAAVPR